MHSSPRVLIHCICSRAPFRHKQWMRDEVKALASISQRSPEAWQCRQKVRTPVCGTEMSFRPHNMTSPNQIQNKTFTKKREKRSLLSISLTSMKKKKKMIVFLKMYMLLNDTRMVLQEGTTHLKPKYVVMFTTRKNQFEYPKFNHFLNYYCSS